MNIRYATEADLRKMFGGTVPTTMRAVVVERDGEILGIGGVARAQDHMQAFSRVSDELRPHKITLGRVAVMVRKMIDEMDCVWALCDPNEPTSPNLLEWIGFKHQHDGMWAKKKGGV